MRYLLNFGGVIESDDLLYSALENDGLIGATWEDLENNKYVEMSNEQVEWFKNYEQWKNYIDPYNFYYMIKPDVEEINEAIKKTRERIYASKTDRLYMAHIKYNMIDQAEKANIALNDWKEAIQQVKNENPYIPEL